MRLLIIALLTTLYFPIFVPLFLIKAGVRIYNPLVYSALLLILLIVFSLRRQTVKSYYTYNNGHINKFSLWLLIFNLFFITVTFIKGLYVDDLLFAYRESLGFFISVLIIIYTYKKGFLRNYKNLFDKLSLYLGFFLVIQTLISIYESIMGVWLIPSDLYTDIGSRDILSLFNISLLNLFGFKGVFCGLLFTHNMFGSMLAFYNVVFLLRYFEERKPIYLFFIMVVIVAVIGNTSRFAIFSVLLSDALIFYKMMGKRSRFLLCGVILFILLLYGQSFWREWDNYVYGTNIFDSRLGLWQYLFNSKIYTWNLSEFIFGVNLDEYINFTVGYMGHQSLENGYLQILVLLGSVGLSLYLYVFHIRPIRLIRREVEANKIASLLFVINITMVSFICGIFHFATYLIVTLLYLRCGIGRAQSYRIAMSQTEEPLFNGKRK